MQNVSPRKVYERKLKRPLCAEARQAIDRLIAEHSAELPVSVRATWVKEQVLNLKSPVASLWLVFRPDKLVVLEERSGASKWFSFVGGKKVVVAWIDEVADRLGM